jgi:hypothetical protein
MSRLIEQPSLVATFLCVFFENVSHFLNEVSSIVIHPPLSVAWK